MTLLNDWEQKIERALENRRWTKEDRIRVLSVVVPTLEVLLSDTISNVEASVVQEILEDLEAQRIEVPPMYWKRRWSSALRRHADCDRAVGERLEKLLRRISRPKQWPRNGHSNAV
jgi:hypothetical protein